MVQLKALLAIDMKRSPVSIPTIGIVIGASAMRYTKDEKLLRLAIYLQGDAGGRSLEDIQGEFEVGRRTAERMRDAVGRVFPQMQEVETGERTKRWKLPSRTLNSLVGFSAQELVGLDNAVALFRRENRQEQAHDIGAVAAKLKALQSSGNMRRVEPDYEALLEAEGLAMRPGPRPRINSQIVGELRKALLSCTRTRIHLRYRTSGKRGYQTVCPYGFLYGNRHYLVADTEHPETGTFRLFSLSDIEKVSPRNSSFARREDFSLQTYAQNSFGVFQEEPFDVVWRFSPKAAEDAAEYLFHPGQKLEKQKDGSLIVRFRAGGRREMDWHLYTWGNEVEVLKPEGWNDFVHEGTNG